MRRQTATRRVATVTPFERMRAELLAWSSPEGMSPSVLLQLGEPLRGTLRHIMRRGSATFAELAEHLGLGPHETETIADLLVACGFLKTSEPDGDGGTTYRIRHTRTPRPQSPVAVWNVLLDHEEEPEDPEGR